MGARHLESRQPGDEASTLESWPAGHCDDGETREGTAFAVAGITTLLLALAAFFITFAPAS